MALAKDIDYVIGVDTHKDSHSAAVVNRMGGVIWALDLSASETGYRRLLAAANRDAVGRRAWAVEGTGSYGSGLATFLVEHGEQVLESNDRVVHASSQRSRINWMRSGRPAKLWPMTSWPSLVGEERGRRFESCSQLEKEL